VSTVQGERKVIDSPTVAVEDGDLVLAGWSETLAQGSGSGTRADAGGPTAALLDHATQEADGRLLRDEKHRVRGRRWVAADGESVYVVGVFERARDGTLSSTGEVTVGRGRFEDRLAEEHERLDRWTRRGTAGAVALALSVAALTSTLGVR
jgi:hypothetical protein